MELPINCDAALGAARDYFERVTREYHTKGPGAVERSKDVQARQSLAVQLHALRDWEHYMFGRLKVFKVSPKPSGDAPRWANRAPARAATYPP